MRSICCVIIPVVYGFFLICETFDFGSQSVVLAYTYFVFLNSSLANIIRPSVFIHLDVILLRVALVICRPLDRRVRLRNISVSHVPNFLDSICSVSQSQTWDLVRNSRGGASSTVNRPIKA